MNSQDLASKIKGVRVASQLLATHDTSTPHAWTLDALAGRFVELFGGAATSALSIATSLVYQAQCSDQPCAWIANTHSIFYPPDFAASGIDLDALPVIRAPDPTRAARVSDMLLKSGGFALIVLDLGSHHQLPMACQTRLTGLAKHHHTAVICLTRVNKRSSLSSLVSMRAESQRSRHQFNQFDCALTVTKDKQSRPGWQHKEVHCGPDGLC